MAHTCCIKKHSMWDGDGKPVVYAFRVQYIKEFMEKNPQCLFLPNSYYMQMYDCVDEVQGEDLDCWYCDECGCLAVFVDNYRYDYEPLEQLPDSTDLADWQEYIALRDKEFDLFSDFYEGLSPLEAIERYPFKYKYMVSNDKNQILAFDRNSNLCFGFKLVRFVNFKEKEERVIQELVN